MERILSADDFSFDHLGTPVAVSDMSGQVVWTHRFSPFGRTIELNEDADGDGVTLTLNLRFPGQYYDAESGLHYNWHRYYDPETGRYLTYDLEIDEYYNYSQNDPIRNYDVLGLQTCKTIPGGEIAEAKDKLELFLKSNNYRCSPVGNCGSFDNIFFLTCDKLSKPKAVGEADRRRPFHPHCEIKFLESAWNTANVKRRACMIAHEYCHLRTDDNIAKGECTAYTVQMKCLDFFGESSDECEQTAKDECKDEHEPYRGDNGIESKGKLPCLF